MIHYEHTQRAGLVLWTGVAIPAVVSFYVAIVEQQLWVSSIGFLLCLVIALFASLTVRIDQHSLQVRFGPGIIRFTFELSDIADHRQVRNKWWYGWGVRLTPHGWLYNINGLDAVEIDLKQGRRIRIGTDEPEELVRRLSHACQSATGLR